MIAYTEKQLAAFAVDRRENWKKWRRSMSQALQDDWLAGTHHHAMQWMNNYYALGLSAAEIEHLTKRFEMKRFGRTTDVGA